MVKVFIEGSDNYLKEWSYNMKSLIISFLNDESGQTTTEYILLLAVVAAIIFKFKDAFSTKMTDIINKVFNNPQLDSLLGQ